jgi:hypothetical protein
LFNIFLIDCLKKFDFSGPWLRPAGSIRPPLCAARSPLTTHKCTQPPHKCTQLPPKSALNQPSPRSSMHSATPPRKQILRDFNAFRATGTISFALYHPARRYSVHSATLSPSLAPAHHPARATPFNKKNGLVIVPRNNDRQ